MSKQETKIQQKYTVVLRDHSIGANKKICGSRNNEFTSKEEAKAYARRMNKHLSPFEKKYYKLLYQVIAIED